MEVFCLAWTVVIRTQKKSLKRSLICCKGLMLVWMSVFLLRACARCNMSYTCVQIHTERWFYCKICGSHQLTLHTKWSNLNWLREQVVGRCRKVTTSNSRCNQMCLFSVVTFGTYLQKMTTPESDVNLVLWLFDGYGDKLIVSRG